MTSFRIQFDPAKARENLKKHKVRLADGESVLYVSNALTTGDYDHHELRWVTLGDNGQRTGAIAGGGLHLPGSLFHKADFGEKSPTT